MPETSTAYERLSALLADRADVDAPTLIRNTLGISNPAEAAAILDGTRALSASETAYLADALGVKASWLLTGQMAPVRQLDFLACRTENVRG